MHKTKNTAMLGSRVNWLARLWAAVVSWLTLAEPEGKIRAIIGELVVMRTWVSDSSSVLTQDSFPGGHFRTTIVYRSDFRGKIRVGDSVYRRPDGRFQTEQPNG